MQSSVRDYWSVWKQFVLHGVMQDDVLPPAVLQSWRRCAVAGLDAYITTATNDTPELPPRFVSSPSTLLALVRPAIEDLYQFVEVQNVWSFLPTLMRVSLI